MHIPILDPAVQNQKYMRELEATATRVLRSGQYILGKEVELFEEKCGQYLDTKHAIGVSSGTDALLLSLMALGIGPGDEVICPSFTFFATAGAIIRTGATPVFVDINRHTFNIDPVCVKEAITEKTVAVIPVHLFGQTADMQAIKKISIDHNLLIVEDACQSFGSRWFNNVTYDQPRVGTIGDIGCFSFFPSKNLGGFGDAGLITTNNDMLAEKIRQLRVHGATERYRHLLIGGNFRIDAMQAALLSVKLNYLHLELATRQNIHRYYKSKFLDLPIVLPEDVQGIHTWNQFTIRTHRRNVLKAYLTEHGIGCGVYYPTPLHKQPCFMDLNPKGLSLPVTEKICEECLSLSTSPHLTQLQLDYTSLVMDSFYK